MLGHPQGGETRPLEPLDYNHFPLKLPRIVLFLALIS